MLPSFDVLSLSCRQRQELIESLQVPAPDAEPDSAFPYFDVLSLPCRQRQELIESLQVPAPDAELLKFSSKFACSTPQQFMIILRKFFTLYNRMPEYNAVRFFFTCVFGLLIGAIFWRKGNKRYTALFFFGSLLWAKIEAEQLVSWICCCKPSSDVMSYANVNRCPWYEGRRSLVPYILRPSFRG